MTEHEHKAAVLRVARNLERDGYQVLIEPPSESIPIDLHGYQPDIVANRADEHIIVEVKARSNPRNLERYKEIADLVKGHTNWRFMLTTVTPDYASDQPAITGSTTPEELSALLKRLDLLIKSENYDFAIPYLWNALMVGLRLEADRKHVPVDATSDLRVINYMYSLGEISHEDYETFKSYYELRNAAVHRLNPVMDREQITGFHNYLRAKLAEWKLEPSGVARDIRAN
jgi:REase_AHJR-like